MGEFSGRTARSLNLGLLGCSGRHHNRQKGKARQKKGADRIGIDPDQLAEGSKDLLGTIWRGAQSTSVDMGSFKRRFRGLLERRD